MNITSQIKGVSARPRASDDSRPGRDHDPAEGPRRLLIVEDNEDTSQVLRMWLESGGYEVVTAGDGWDGVQSVLHNHYDAILMDMSLPTMDGMSALRLIRAHEGLRRVPVVAITAYDAAYPRAEAMESMCDEYLIKPLDFGRLEAVLERILC